ncbi:MAG TPA: CPBP family intramembrane glutamic endopeptidase [Dehalococcoidia bacterium]|nr:CPBP family intramembrane glutamic endopeptidase [Dehalococcoidia bacterium]
MDLNELPGPAPASTAFTAPPPAAAPWGLADILRGIGLAVLGSIVVLAVAALAVVVVNRPHSDAETLAVLIPNLGLEAVLLLVPILLVVGKHRGSLRDLGFRAPQRGGLWLAPLLVVGGWIIISVYFAALSALGLGGLSDQQQLPDRAFESPALIAVVGVLALGAAPLCEETFFRGFVFPGLLRRWRFPVAALASGLLFALAHIYPVLYVPFALIGALFAFGYFYSGSLWVPMAAHFMFNGISFAIGVLSS